MILNPKYSFLITGVTIILFGAPNIQSQINEKELINYAYESTYEPETSSKTIITNANILTGRGDSILDASILMDKNKIIAVGKDLDSSDATVVDAEGKWVTPGIIDIHSHMGVYPAPSLRSNSDGNEATSPTTPHVWAEHSVWTQDPQYTLALKGGITSFHVLVGSANLIGGRGVTLKNVRSRTVQGMKFPNAPYTLKMACGENPKRVYGGRNSEPSTRMGNVAGYRNAWIEAQAYQRRLTEYAEKSDEAKEMSYSPSRDLGLETLVGVLEGDILVQMHCYRGEEMAVMLDVAKEFEYKITTFHHAIEAYKVADILAQNSVCAAMWADWWGFKHEAFDMVWENTAIVDQAENKTGCAIVHSDSAVGIQRLNQEAAKALAAGQKIGLDLNKERAIQWITLNPAKALGIDDHVGSIEPGKMADIVVWSHDPFSVYSRAEKVFIDGHLKFDINDPGSFQRTDFDIGIIDPEGDRL
ncbi:MAG: amidohydrolase [Gammaproteobacteria bacterium]|jgi:imidazolonepropionase-like amidohydrolase|nr:amidohydrolase [Gammaproteobacteria bacterium]MBQ09217.1 amidohydrolase [Gammaproteobacteria bacterium]MDP6146439.1 amidohydrolase [Gammaproteobacteria bacterium]HJM08705.1 amidohydrolase [Gammaproteobacteria bacterium]|tara:strand:- start:17882 stop:19297 length:1416 start_codon:yes stop_codon:yes gene_type:complete